MTDLEIIKEIDRIRRERFLTIADLAKIGECAQTILYDWFKGRYIPRTLKSKKALRKIAEHFEIIAPEKKYGLVELPKQTAIPVSESVVFSAKPKEKPDTFIRLDNGLIANAKTGKTYSIEEFNELFE